MRFVLLRGESLKTMPQPVPRRIIQTGKTVELALKQRAVVCNLKLLNPDFEYLYFDDDQVENFIDAEYPHYRAVFDAFPFRIQKFDFFRYLAVYKLGGFYFDLDVLLATSIAPLVSSECVFPFEGLGVSRYLREAYGMDWQIGNYAFGARAGHPFLAAVIENCVRAQREPTWVAPVMRSMPWLSRSQFYVLHTTGPGLLSRTLAESADLASGVTVLMPDDVCEPSNWNLFGDYGIHLMDGSWREQSGWVKKKVADYFELRLLRRMRAESLRLRSERRSTPTWNMQGTAAEE
jgi:hypothetical protein